MATTMNIFKENITFESELKDILKNKMRCLMTQSFNMFKAYAEVTKQSYFDIAQDIQIEGGEKFHLTVHLSNKKNLITCSVTTVHGITLELSANFGEAVNETVVDVSEEEAKNYTTVVDKYKAPEKEEPPKQKEQPPTTRKYGSGHRIPTEIRQEIANHIKEGKSLQWVIETYKISRPTVHTIAKEYGIEKERIAKTPDAEMVKRMQRYSDDIITSFAKGESIVYCSNLYQISRTALINFRKSHEGAIETRKKELAEKELGLRKAPVENDPAKNPGMDKESYIIEELIRGELNSIEIASKFQTTTAVVDKIADLNGALINKRKEYMKSKKNKHGSTQDPSHGGPASAESIRELKDHFEGR